MWYGQKETDRVIAKYFPEGYSGNCIEVGCSDGIRGSNSKYFEDNGWNCLCIDPILDHYLMAKSNKRKHVICLACDKEVGQKDFTIYNIGKNNIQSSLSSLKTDERLFVSHGSLINNKEVIKVKTDTLNNIIKRNFNYSVIDFISIDTEGTELDVLMGLDLTANNSPYLLVIENNFEDPGIEEYLLKYNYIKTERYFVNDFYIKN